jgi:hypothetical protein
MVSKKSKKSWEKKEIYQKAFLVSLQAPKPPLRVPVF